jgi:hypothetical protein
MLERPGITELRFSEKRDRTDQVLCIIRYGRSSEKPVSGSGIGPRSRLFGTKILRHGCKINVNFFYPVTSMLL